MAPERKLFMTGATGIVGRALLQRLAGDKRSAGRNMPAVVALSRNVSAFPEAGVRAVHGRISEPEGWQRELEGTTEFVHMAALTGKARASDFQRANVEGTRSVLEACKRAGVRRFLFISSIAATYPEHDAYPYGRSKLEAEALVRESGLEWAIVRPTIVMSRRAKIWHSLEGMASLAVVPMFGGGHVRIQPIHADDLALALEAWLGDPSLDRGTYDLGGPEVVTFRDFLGRIHRRKKGGEATFLPLPGKSAIAVLKQLEKFLLPVLPMSAGQLYSFVYDGTAKPNPLSERFVAGQRNVDTMLDELLKYG
jgi:nucleoside-diphosphate-sugar epimerase